LFLLLVYSRVIRTDKKKSIKLIFSFRSQSILSSMRLTRFVIDLFWFTSHHNHHHLHHQDGHSKFIKDDIVLIDSGGFRSKDQTDVIVFPLSLSLSLSLSLYLSLLYRIKLSVDCTTDKLILMR
ncbi:hypothetical protein SSS_03892, partial [Sarcoptes scabiei]